MFRKLLLLLPILPTLLQATELAVDQTSYDIIIKQLSYQKNNSPLGGEGGTLLFSKFDFSSDSLQISLDNKDNVYNSAIIVRPESLGLWGPNIKIGVRQERDSFVNDIEKLLVDESQFTFTPSKLSLQGSLVEATIKASYYNFTEVNFECSRTGNASLIAQDCLNHGQILPLISDKPFGMKFRTMTLDKKDNHLYPFTVEGVLDIFRMTENHVDLAGRSLSLYIDTTTAIKIEKPVIACEKSLVQKGDEQLLEGLTSTCTNALTTTFSKIVINRGKEKSLTRISPSELTVSDGRMRANLEAVQFSKDGKQTELKRVGLSCQKNRATELFSFLGMISDCARSGKVLINTIVSSEDERITKKNGKNLIVENTPVKDISLTFENNLWRVSMDVAALGTYFRVRIKGGIIVDKKNEEIILSVERAVWRGIPMKSLALHFIKKYILGNDVYMKNEDTIVIKMGSDPRKP